MTEEEREEVERMRAMTPDERLALAFVLTARARRDALGGLRRLHPNETEKELNIRLAELRYGPEAARRIRTAILKRAAAT